MNPPASPGKIRFVFFLALLILIFTLGFFLSFARDQSRARDTGRLAWSHLIYVLDLKDDMAVVDWSKNLETLEIVAAFRVKSAGKVVIDGGNLEFLPAAVPEGVSFRAPDRWIFEQREEKAGREPREFVMALHFHPGPLLWGLFGLTACLLSYWFNRGSGKQALQSPEGGTAHSEGGSRTSPPPPHPPTSPSQVPSGLPYLFLDKHYVIQQISPEASALLQRPSSDLLQGHLFDLEPDPLLMEALSKNQEVKLLKSFKSYQHLSAVLKPDQNGTLVFLERIEPAKTT